MLATFITSLINAVYFSWPVLGEDPAYQSFPHLLFANIIGVFLIGLPVWLIGIYTMGFALWDELRAHKGTVLWAALAATAAASVPAAVIAAVFSGFGFGPRSQIFLASVAFSGAIAGAFVYWNYRPPQSDVRND